MIPTTADVFAKDYADARARFLAAAMARNIEPVTYQHPKAGPSGESLCTDVISLGEPTAPNVLIINSATHGGEGFCGSAAVTDTLLREVSPPDNVHLLLIHAINPYGFAWLRRVTDANVDLNRNFIDHDGPRPANDDFEQLFPDLLPTVWEDHTGDSLAATLEDYAEQHGTLAMQSALSRGQYAHPDGPFFGGQRADWSNDTFRTILARAGIGGGTVRHVAFLDFHTGLGPFGHAELISKCAPDDPEFARLRKWFGLAVKTSAAGESTSPMLTGLIATAIRDVMPEGAVSALTVEYGTYPVRDVLLSVLADNWLHARGDLSSPIAARIKADLKERFSPDDDDWRELVLVRARQLITRGLQGLAADA